MASLWASVFVGEILSHTALLRLQGAPSCPSNCGKNSAFSPRSRTSWISPQLPSHPAWVLGWGVWPQCAPCHWWCWFGTAWSVLASCIECTACGERPPHSQLDQHHPSSTSLCIRSPGTYPPPQPLQEVGSCEAPASEGSSVEVGRARAVREGLASALSLRPGAGVRVVTPSPGGLGAEPGIQTVSRASGSVPGLSWVWERNSQILLSALLLRWTVSSAGVNRNCLRGSAKDGRT